MAVSVFVIVPTNFSSPTSNSKSYHTASTAVVLLLARSWHWLQPELPVSWPRRHGDAAIIENVPARKTKCQAPDEIKPTNRFGSPQGSIDHFMESRAKTEAFVKDTPGLRDHAADSPVGPKSDAYEFVLLITAHSERHTNQIKEVKADPDYPKN
jgi:hypothetical protein